MERGQLVGPRIYQTGTIIYGAGASSYHQDVVDMDEARSALLRIKVEGGPSSFSYKNYNLPSRSVVSYVPVRLGLTIFQSVSSEAASRCSQLVHAMRAGGCK